MQASKHMPVMLHDDRMWSALVQVPEIIGMLKWISSICQLDFPVSALLLGSCWVRDWLSKSQMLLYTTFTRAHLLGLARISSDRFEKAHGSYELW